MAPCGMQFGEKCWEQERRGSLITSRCFDHVSALFVFVCVCIWAREDQASVFMGEVPR